MSDVPYPTALSRDHQDKLTLNMTALTFMTRVLSQSLSFFHKLALVTSCEMHTKKLVCINLDYGCHPLPTLAYGIYRRMNLNDGDLLVAIAPL